MWCASKSVVKHTREISSNTSITQIPTIHIYVKETGVVSHSTHYCVQKEFTYRVHIEYINQCDVGDNFSKTKKPTIDLLQEHPYTSL